MDGFHQYIGRVWNFHIPRLPHTLGLEVFFFTPKKQTIQTAKKPLEVWLEDLG